MTKVNPELWRPQLDPDIDPESLMALAQLAEQLERERPLPRAAFRGDLRRLIETLDQPVPRPPRMWALVAASAALGGVLLGIGALAASGAVPL